MSRPVVAYIHLANLRHNYRLLNRLAAGAQVMSVIKADAYGHGLRLVAPALQKEGCHSFAVTNAEEGAVLRGIIGRGSAITLLSGIFDQEGAALCCLQHLTPALTEHGQVKLLHEAGFHGQAWIKVDTGMNRLGTQDVPGLYDACKTAGIGIAGLMSHLACADEPEHALNAVQVERFERIAASLPADTPKSLLNSAGLISIGRRTTYDVVRPGIALYGAEPVASMPIGLKPVMSFCGSVIQLRDIPAGESVSYGASFITSKPVRIATISTGYADGLPRLLSNQGLTACVGTSGTAILPIVGRVCMDYCLLDASGCDIETGMQVEFWGEHVSAAKVAEQVGSIAYELFTGISSRVPRQAIE
ncbi:MAG: alanine racemase [Zetaproteobacteria bacterium CG06_land_8_20_14_3_00_59_53]|nr:MAG: alanine racemase [Zetaproteobacteria bacterium CG2_30_59_37]PIO90638.1 MAG: alanine racemase [Zetaproteobacteria bacterium CG23_combo_of_CG06-09_8_20_14_all_59_86]PIQ66098.1 MAG: alanine racemase [Zetaproteobacteria bacterium CG11_big_fil_rev_8_21_14_0_20_59_439]PIU71585.1 MAG: alanine racemase [Zetaproteobacteria bacterium CG06_land_8_20_14_3_00_59_53]PIU97846.1 MAG: alanine racemase [Zetaproteobacteria bacterium CG03_land_8_20_14_0_80_59_51]PIY45881.1 MAG: alanine racemase [Zetaprote